MPSTAFVPLSPPATIAVTGANGFIASHVVAQLLEAGYKVVGTVRSSVKAAQVEKVHEQNERLKAIVISDITSTEAVTTALESCLGTDEQLAAIVHLAAPFTYSVTNFEQDLLQPAIKGSQAILQAAKHFQSRGLQRVIHTNSFACIYDAAAGSSPERVYTSKDWSPLTYEDGLNAPSAPVAYRAAKTVAEKAAWAFMEREQGIAFDLVSLCPAMVFGPFLETAMPASIEELNESNKIVWDVVGRDRDAELPPTKAPVWVDVRDVAKSHVLALINARVSGDRLMLAAGVYCNQEVADETRQALPKCTDKIPVGKPLERQADKHFGVDATREAALLGIKWRSLGESLRDLVPQLFEIQAR